jgi:hypothetical protein
MRHDGPAQVLDHPEALQPLLCFILWRGGEIIMNGLHTLLEYVGQSFKTTPYETVIPYLSQGTVVLSGTPACVDSEAFGTVDSEYAEERLPLLLRREIGSLYRRHRGAGDVPGVPLNTLPCLLYLVINIRLRIFYASRESSLGSVYPGRESSLGSVYPGGYHVIGLRQFYLEFVYAYASVGMKFGTSRPRGGAMQLCSSHNIPHDVLYDP